MTRHSSSRARTLLAALAISTALIISGAACFDPILRPEDVIATSISATGTSLVTTPTPVPTLNPAVFDGLDTPTPSAASVLEPDVATPQPTSTSLDAPTSTPFPTSTRPPLRNTPTIIGTAVGALLPEPRGPNFDIRHNDRQSAPTYQYGEWKGIGSAAFTIVGLPDDAAPVLYWIHDDLPDYSKTPVAFRGPVYFKVKAKYSGIETGEVLNPRTTMSLGRNKGPVDVVVQTLGGIRWVLRVGIPTEETTATTPPQTVRK